MNRFINIRLPFINLLFFILLVFNFIEITAQSSIVEYHSLQSNVLAQKIDYTIILPKDYYKKNVKYPTIYLFHGINGDGASWIRRCNFNRLIDSLENFHLISDFIYIMPDAHNSYYIDNFDKSFCYESFLIKEFIPHIDSLYRTIPSSQTRTLMGLSMGGFGAMIMGIKHPDIFSSIISMSGALRDSATFVVLPQEKYNRLFAKVYGPQLKAQDRITEHWKLNCPFYLIDSVNAASLRMMNWYIDCASGDSLYPVNEVFHEYLMNNQIPHEFHTRPGEHNWKYWYQSSINALIYNSYLMNQKLNSTHP